MLQAKACFCACCKLCKVQPCQTWEESMCKPWFRKVLWQAGAAGAVAAGHDCWGSLLFCLSLNHKQMSMYYAPAFFAHLLGKCLQQPTPLRKVPTKGLQQKICLKQQLMSIVEALVSVCGVINPTVVIVTCQHVCVTFGRRLQLKVMLTVLAHCLFI